MKTSSDFANNKRTDFEAWAALLICRKVPDAYQPLVNPEVIHHGAEILRHGNAFEVRIRECEGASGHREILVTPLPD